MLKNFALAFLSLLVTILVCELVLAAMGMLEPSPRLYPGGIPDANPMSDPVLGWTQRPNASIEARPRSGEYDVVYRTNAQGFRDPTDFEDLAGSASANGGTRIAFVGDSFTFGTGVDAESTFVRRVERAFPNVEAVNLGVSGFGLDQIWLTVRHHVAPLRPDVVVLSFIVNDLGRSMNAYRRRDEWVRKPAFEIGDDGRLRPLLASDRPSGIHGFLVEHSRILTGLRQVQEHMNVRIPMGHRWRLNRKIFEAIREEAADMGAELLVVYVPAGGYRRDEIPGFHEEFRDMGIPLLDLQPLLIESPHHYFRRNGHLTPSGHAVAADPIVAELTARGWIK